MITLWQAENLPFEDVERLATACDDRLPVSVKLVRSLARRAMDARRDDVARINELQNKVTLLEIALEEADGATE